MLTLTVTEQNYRLREWSTWQHVIDVYRVAYPGRLVRPTADTTHHDYPSHAKLTQVSSCADSFSISE